MCYRRRSLLIVHVTINVKKTPENDSMSMLVDLTIEKDIGSVQIIIRAFNYQLCSEHILSSNRC